MRKFVLVLALYCVFAGAATAQQAVSQFEGRWVWDGTGDYDFNEINFFGDVMMLSLNDFGEEVIVGFNFSHSDEHIYIFGTYPDEDSWRMPYRLSGDLLSIDFDDEDEWVSFIKNQQTKRSPLEGFWKVTNIVNPDLFLGEVVSHFLFTQDIMAFRETAFGYYIGFRVHYDGQNIIALSEEFEEYNFYYRLQGNSLLLITEYDERIELVRVYSIVP